MLFRIIKDMTFKCDFIVISLILLFGYIILFDKVNIIEGKRKRKATNKTVHFLIIDGSCTAHEFCVFSVCLSNSLHFLLYLVFLL